MDRTRQQMAERGRETFPWAHYYDWAQGVQVRRQEERWEWSYHGGLERYEAARAATLAMMRGAVLHVRHAEEQDDESFLDRLYTVGGPDGSLLDQTPEEAATIARGEPEAQLAILLTRLATPAEVLEAVEWSRA